MSSHEGLVWQSSVHVHRRMELQDLKQSIARRKVAPFIPVIDMSLYCRGT